MDEKKAVRRIEEMYIRYKYKQIFQLMKNSLYCAENNLTENLFKQISPKECWLLSDPILHVRLKLKFGGAVFPPMLYYKINTDMINPRADIYMNAKMLITDNEETMKDRKKLMGINCMNLINLYDKYFDEKCKLYSNRKRIDNNDVNCWRRLDEGNIPKLSLLSNIMDFVVNCHKEKKIVLTDEMKNSIKLLDDSQSDLERKVLLQKMVKNMSDIVNFDTPPNSRKSDRYSAFSDKQIVHLYLKRLSMFGLTANEKSFENFMKMKNNQMKKKMDIKAEFFKFKNSFVNNGNNVASKPRKMVINEKEKEEWMRLSNLYGENLINNPIKKKTHVEDESFEELYQWSSKLLADDI
ncbi:hypothetical protein SNEBB_002169 [Seison nebaliae]|nr:hypothetical protein SNEBB_002169 [Seison nebaliae]